MTQVLLCQERVARLSHNVPINPSDCADLLLISPDVALNYAKVDQSWLLACCTVGRTDHITERNSDFLNVVQHCVVTGPVPQS